jgi:predicted nucleic acid-binding protein
MSLRADFRVCLDANVLANQAVCDLLLRLAEYPRLYSPVLSADIMREVYTVHTERLKRPWPAELAEHWQNEVMRTFPEAIITDYEALIPALEMPDKDDRHVLAATIKGHAQHICTFNIKDYPASALETWNIEAVHPQAYLATLYELSPQLVTNRIHEIAESREVIPIRKRSDL